jgi:hypothetical protein
MTVKLDRRIVAPWRDKPPDQWQVERQAERCQRTDWNDVAERRLDPGGLFVLQGQRLGAWDLYRYCADKLGDDEGPDDGEPAGRMYHHMVWKGHYDDRCRGDATHRQTAPPYPEGCLLDPRRLTWREINHVRRSDASTYSVVIQQEDADPADTLLKSIWVTGTDPDTGDMVPGCWDKGRDIGELPPGLAGDLLSYATVDPSAARWWCQQWWGGPLRRR